MLMAIMLTVHLDKEAIQKKYFVHLAPKGNLNAFDLDELAEVEAKKIKNPNFSFHKTNFKNIGDYFNDDELDGILIDCGVSSPQIDEPSRGFSFMRDGPLDMRFGNQVKLTCESIINNYAYEDLVRIFKRVWGRD